MTVSGDGVGNAPIELEVRTRTNTTSKTYIHIYVKCSKLCSLLCTHLFYSECSHVYITLYLF